MPSSFSLRHASPRSTTRSTSTGLGEALGCGVACASVGRMPLALRVIMCAGRSSTQRPCRARTPGRRPRRPCPPVAWPAAASPSTRASAAAPGPWPWRTSASGAATAPARGGRPVPQSSPVQWQRRWRRCWPSAGALRPPSAAPWARPAAAAPPRPRGPGREAGGGVRRTALPPTAPRRPPTCRRCASGPRRGGFPRLRCAPRRQLPAP
mmetsp:Transcript_19126/g.60168  ORF Transcript_19126/g.60168 Transcript_19126/m.60168 type:complete len:209 (+) Transcript_19126:428-1054(+)